MKSALFKDNQFIKYLGWLECELYLLADKDYYSFEYGNHDDPPGICCRRIDVPVVALYRNGFFVNYVHRFESESDFIKIFKHQNRVNSSEC